MQKGICWSIYIFIHDFTPSNEKEHETLKVYSVHLRVFADPLPTYKQSSKLRLYFLQVSEARRVDAGCLSQHPPPRQPARLQRCVVGVASASGDGA